jgi:phosphoribosylformylglycinamidine synthase
MTLMKANVIVKLKSAVHDPQGETIRRALEQLELGQVESVRQGKFFELTVDASSKEEAEKIARDIALRVLSNPVLEVFQVEIES